MVASDCFPWLRKCRLAYLRKNFTTASDGKVGGTKAERSGNPLTVRPGRVLSCVRALSTDLGRQGQPADSPLRARLDQIRIEALDVLRGMDT